MIFESVHNFSHKFKHKAPLIQKEKENSLKPEGARLNGPQAGPHGR
jgi:hypothetical protein